MPSGSFGGCSTARLSSEGMLGTANSAGRAASRKAILVFFAKHLIMFRV